MPPFLVHSSRPSDVLIGGPRHGGNTFKGHTEGMINIHLSTFTSLPLATLMTRGEGFERLAVSNFEMDLIRSARSGRVVILTNRSNHLKPGLGETGFGGRTDPLPSYNAVPFVVSNGKCTHNLCLL